MKRRNLLKAGLITSGAALLSNISLLKSQNTNKSFSGKSSAKLQSKVKPSFLKENDSVGIIAPATSVTSPDDLAKAYELLDYLKLKPKLAKNLLDNDGYKTKSKSERAADVNSMFEDKEVKAIICIRGGYGSMGILNLLDYSLIRKNPKIFIGYSDITAMHLAINEFAGLVTLHAPMLLSDFSGNTIDFYKTTLFSNNPIGKISNPINDGVRETFPVRTINPGIATGELVGGNLSLITALMGTKYEIQTENKILFIEDVGEEPYSIDRMLTHLSLAGKFENIKGIVFGKCQECVQKSVPPVWDSSLAEVLDEQFRDLNVPIFYGLLFGHTSIQYPIPYSIEATINATDCYLEITESYCV